MPPGLPGRRVTAFEPPRSGLADGPAHPAAPPAPFQSGDSARVKHPGPGGPALRLIAALQNLDTRPEAARCDRRFAVSPFPPTRPGLIEPRVVRCRRPRNKKCTGSAGAGTRSRPSRPCSGFIEPEALWSAVTRRVAGSRDAAGIARAPSHRFRTAAERPRRRGHPTRRASGAVSKRRFGASKTYWPLRPCPAPHRRTPKSGHASGGREVRMFRVHRIRT